MLAQYERLSQALQAIRKTIGEDHLTVSQAVVMRAVIQSKTPPSQTALVEATHIDRSTMADIVRRLTKAGLLRRRRARHDARAYEVVATPEGERMLKAFEHDAHRAASEIDRVLGELGIRLV